MFDIKKIAAGICALAIVSGASAFSVRAEELSAEDVSQTAVYADAARSDVTEKEASALTYTWNADEGILTIMGKIPEPESEFDSITKNVPEISDTKQVKKIIILQGTELPQNCERLFYGLESLTEISGLEYLDTSKVTDMNSMFAYCYNLESLNVSGFDTRNVTDMFYMFSGCKNVKELDLNKFDTSSLERAGGMFQLCESSEALDISSFILNEKNPDLHKGHESL